MDAGVMWFMYCKHCNNNYDNNMPNNYLHGAQIGVDSTFYVYGHLGLDSSGAVTVQIDEVYKLIQDHWKQNKWGIWKHGYGLEVSNTVIWERRGNLAGVVIRCASAGVSTSKPNPPRIW